MGASVSPLAPRRPGDLSRSATHRIALLNTTTGGSPDRRPLLPSSRSRLALLTPATPNSSSHSCTASAADGVLARCPPALPRDICEHHRRCQNAHSAAVVRGSSARRPKDPGDHVLDGGCLRARGAAMSTGTATPRRDDPVAECGTRARDRAAADRCDKRAERASARPRYSTGEQLASPWCLWPPAGTN